MRLRLKVVASAVVVALASMLLAAPTSAAPDRNSPQGELYWLYVHGLGRAPDQSGFDFYMKAINADCRFGILSASHSILTSPEAQGFLGSPDRYANALYMALLNRQPDPDGWHHYFRQNEVHGIAWTASDVLASPEYARRLQHICAGRNGPSSVGIYGEADASAIIDNLIDAAWVGAFGCGISAVVKKLKQLKGRHHLLTVASMAAEAAQKMGDTKGVCKAAQNAAKAATHIALIVTYDKRAVYVRELTTRSWVTTTHTLWVGHDPNSARQYGPASYRSL